MFATNSSVNQCLLFLHGVHLFYVGNTKEEIDQYAGWAVPGLISRIAEKIGEMLLDFYEPGEKM